MKKKNERKMRGITWELSEYSFSSVQNYY